MKKYRLEATFFAEDLDDAFEKLALHFKLLAEDSDEDPVFNEPGTEFDLKPEEENK